MIHPDEIPDEVAKTPPTAVVAILPPTSQTFAGCGACGDEAPICQQMGCRKYRFKNPLNGPTFHQPLPEPPALNTEKEKQE